MVVTIYIVWAWKHPMVHAVIPYHSISFISIEVYETSTNFHPPHYCCQCTSYYYTTLILYSFLRFKRNLPSFYSRLLHLSIKTKQYALSYIINSAGMAVCHQLFLFEGSLYSAVQTIFSSSLNLSQRGPWFFSATRGGIVWDSKAFPKVHIERIGNQQNIFLQHIHGAPIRSVMYIMQCIG